MEEQACHNTDTWIIAKGYLPFLTKAVHPLAIDIPLVVAWLELRRALNGLAGRLRSHVIDVPGSFLERYV